MIVSSDPINHEIGDPPASIFWLSFCKKNLLTQMNNLSLTCPQQLQWKLVSFSCCLSCCLSSAENSKFSPHTLQQNLLLCAPSFILRTWKSTDIICHIQMKALVPKPYHFINLYPEKHEYTNPYLKLYFSQSFQTCFTWTITRHRQLNDQAKRWTTDDLQFDYQQ